MVNYEVNIRNEFFISALFVENMISSYITAKFKLNGIIDTSILDNNDESISFNDKIELLLESDNLSIIDKSKLSVFREIYKELNINKDAGTFEDCLTSSDSNDDFLLILYPQEDTITREKKLTNACILLIDDVSQLVSHFTDEAPVKLNKRISKLYPLIMSSLSFVFSILLFR
jgi:hypothetical protein